MKFHAMDGNASRKWIQIATVAATCLNFKRQCRTSKRHPDLDRVAEVKQCLHNLIKMAMV